MTVTIPTTPSFIVRTALRKATWDNGFRVEEGVAGGWLAYASTTARGRVWLAGESDDGPWWLATDHQGVAAEFGAGEGEGGPGIARYRFARQPALYAALDRIYALGVSLPDTPLVEFERQAAGMPRGTEAERLTVQRIGQDLFRRALLAYWEGRCAVTGVPDVALLRASHIVPWATCRTDAQRLDVQNGLLLSSLWDAAFDVGLTTFDDEGRALFAPSLSREGRVLLGPSSNLRRRPTQEQRVYLRQHHICVATWAVGAV